VGIEPPGPVHVGDAEQDRAHVRLHALSPLVLGGDAHDRHARCGPATCASRFLTGWVTRHATLDSIGAGEDCRVLGASSRGLMPVSTRPGSQGNAGYT